MNIPTKKKHIENNKAVFLFLASENPAHVPVSGITSTISIVTLTTNINSDFL